MSMFLSIVIMILLLSFLVLVHEAGHFFAARALGIKVTKFGFGLPIGPTLWSKQVGDVEVLVHAFLLGGYVSFPDDEKDSPTPVAEITIILFQTGFVMNLSSSGTTIPESFSSSGNET